MKKTLTQMERMEWIQELTDRYSLNSTALNEVTWAMLRDQLVSHRVFNSREEIDQLWQTLEKSHNWEFPRLMAYFESMYHQEIEYGRE